MKWGSNGDEIEMYLLIWGEIPPNIFLSLCFLKNKQAAAGNILRGVREGAKVLHWDTVVKEAGGLYSRLRA